MPLSDTLPPLVRNVVMSDEFIALKNDLRASLGLSLKQKAELELIIEGLCDQSIKPELLEQEIRSRLGVSEDIARRLEQAFFINLVLTLSSYFGDHFEYYKNKYGDPIKALDESTTKSVLAEYLIGALREQATFIDDFQKNSSQEARAMLDFFRTGIVDFLASPDGAHKVSLNNTLILLIMNEENFPDALLKALYENEEQIGTVPIRVGDQEKEKPTAANWIQDFLGSTGGTVTSIQIAQYLTNSPNTKDLSKNDQETAKRLFQTVQALFEMFAMLKNFPESFEKIPIEQWKIIPYLEEKETTKLPKTLATMASSPATEESVAPVAPPPAPVVAPVSVPASIPESAPTPTSESTSVPAPVVQKVVSAPPQVTASTAKSILPLSTTAVSVASVGMTNFVDAIIEKSGVVLPDDAHERVKKTIETRVRNVRNDIDTRHRLSASPAEGGAGLGDEKVSKIMDQIGVAITAVAEGRGEEYAPSPQNVIPSVSEESREPQERRNPSTTLPSVAPAVIAEREAPPKMVIKEVDGVPTIVEKSEKKGNGKKIEETLVVSESAAVKLAPDLTPPPPSPPPLSEPVKVPEHLKGAQEIPVAVKSPPATSRLPSSPTKKSIPDVKQAPRLVGLTDELRALTIKDLRRMSENPAQACQKIADKINALAKESLSKRAEAISAWKESLAYQLYLEIGQLNLSQDMDKLAQARKAAGKEYLTSEEFDALLDMNEKLRF